MEDELFGETEQPGRAVIRQQEALDVLRRRKRAYQLSDPVLQEVLRDLMQFCRVLESEDETAMKMNTERLLILTGRRQVWLRIERHLKLNVEQLFTIYSGGNFRVGENDVS